jgi:hypothetical protein
MVATMLLALISFWALLSGPAFSQPMPEHASAKSYGDGWQCDVGYRLNEGICTTITVPENAYATNRTYGAGWACRHGFRETSDAICVEVVIPEHGFLDPSGERWHCMRKFRKIGNTCQAIVLPANAYLTNNTYGAAWKCERGYAATGTGCTTIAIPENAHLDRSGNRWECDRNFQKSRKRCFLND